MIIGKLSGLTDAAVRLVKFLGRFTKYSAARFIQHYGYASRPLDDSEGILIKAGDSLVVIGSDNSRYRIRLDNGEVALYTHEGSSIHLKNGNKIRIKCTGTVVVEAATVKLGSDTLLPTSGVVTGECACIFGVPHPVKSTKVLAGL
jgi:phage gp45-like